MGTDTMTVLALIYRAPVAKRARRASEAATESFGPLKAVLGAILAHYANREVSSLSVSCSEFSFGERISRESLL